MWMTLELTIKVFTKFKRYTGLYFYSLLVCTWCISIRQIGRICVFFIPGLNKVFSLIFVLLGWVGMVTGFAIVLYSRLHLVTQNKKILRGVLCMIIFNVFALHLTTMLGQIGVVTKHQPTWVTWYPAVEKLQIVGFTVQETIISSIYIKYTHNLVDDSYNEKTKKSIRLLILVQIICIIVDLPFIYLAFANLFLIKATASSFAYAIKLKLEFVVLNQLLGIVKNGIAPRGLPSTPPSDEECGKRRSSSSAEATHIATLEVHKPEKRRFPLPPRWRRASRTSNAEVCVADMLDAKPTAALPAPRRAMTMTQGSSQANTFMVNSLLTTSSANTDHISRLGLRMDSSLVDVERRYLGQYGVRVGGVV